MRNGRGNRGRVPISQQGFTLLAALITVAALGAGLAAFGELASHAAQRTKEVELLFAGNQYRQAIAGYYRKDRRYPPTLEALLEDKRYPMPQRHLRKLYPDPVTGKPFAVVAAPGGGIMGVHSPSEAAPAKRKNFSQEDQGFVDAKKYADWKFVHTPPASPAGPEAKR